MSATIPFKRLILRAVPRDVSPMVAYPRLLDALRLRFVRDVVRSPAPRHREPPRACQRAALLPTFCQRAGSRFSRRPESDPREPRPAEGTPGPRPPSGSSRDTPRMSRTVLGWPYRHGNGRGFPFPSFSHSPKPGIATNGPATE
jgi:hypothetical protein